MHFVVPLLCAEDLADELEAFSILKIHRHIGDSPLPKGGIGVTIFLVHLMNNFVVGLPFGIEDFSIF